MVAHLSLFFLLPVGGWVGGWVQECAALLGLEQREVLRIIGGLGKGPCVRTLRWSSVEWGGG